MCVEPGAYPSNITKDKKFFETEFSEYNFPNSKIINLERNYNNDITIAVSCLIDTVENEKLPPASFIGKRLHKKSEI